MNVDEIAERLNGATVALRDAKDQLPDDPGFYAWWIRPGAVPNLTRVAHPSEPWDLLYVGIAPNGPSSAQRLCSRIVANHIGGNTGSSTFRFSLAALLFEEAGWVPRRTTKKVVLPRETNAELRAWQEQNARLTWIVEPSPWREGLEAAVIARMKPPLNLANNKSHPFHQVLSDARARFRAAAT